MKEQGHEAGSRRQEQVAQVRVFRAAMPHPVRKASGFPYRPTINSARLSLAFELGNTDRKA